MKLLRQGQTKTVTVNLAELPVKLSQIQNSQDESDSGSTTADALDGVTVSDLDNNVRQHLDIPDDLGARWSRMSTRTPIQPKPVCSAGM